ncbi:efflux RND transporter periplasmic adaptor subunit [Ralstonia pseudosolanacearum]
MLSACGQGNVPEVASASAPGPVTVQTITVQAEPFAQTVELPGRIEATRVAEVRARVAGIVLSRSFTEGADVKAGQVLFQIDPAPLKAALNRAQGGLARAEASLSDTETVVRRYEPLVKIEAVSQQDFDAAKAALNVARAARQTAAAEVETAKLNLDYATVRAPISGRIGRAMATEGALVGQNETTLLATIQQIDPVYVDFRQPVADAVRMRDAMAQGQLTREGGAVPTISVTVEGSDKKRDGKLMFSDITVDRGTGNIALRGQVQNTDNLLLPGMYVRVAVSVGTAPNAILVPQRAVQRNANGQAQVLVVGKDGTAEVRTVQTGEMQGAQWLIRQGLQSGDRVIVGGGATAGVKVTVAAATEKARS